MSHLGYLRLALLPGLVCVALTLALVLALHPDMLTGRYTVDPPPEPHEPHEPALLRMGLVVCALVGPSFAIGPPPWLVALVAATVRSLATAILAPRFLRQLSLPWLMAGGFAVLAVVVALVQEAGWLPWLTTLIGQGTASVDLLRVAGVSAAAANLVDNLPAYLAVEPAGRRPWAPAEADAGCRGA